MIYKVTRKITNYDLGLSPGLTQSLKEQNLEWGLNQEDTCNLGSWQTNIIDDTKSHNNNKKINYNLGLNHGLSRDWKNRI